MIDVTIVFNPLELTEGSLHSDYVKWITKLEKENNESKKD